MASSVAVFAFQRKLLIIGQTFFFEKVYNAPAIKYVAVFIVLAIFFVLVSFFFFRVDGMAQYPFLLLIPRGGGEGGREEAWVMKGEPVTPSPLQLSPPKNKWKKKKQTMKNAQTLAKIFICLKILPLLPIILFSLLFFGLFSCMCVRVCFFRKRQKTNHLFLPLLFSWGESATSERGRKERERMLLAVRDWTNCNRVK